MHRLLLIFALGFVGSIVSAQEKPNVVVFLADDQGPGDYSCMGNRDLQTINIDRLAKDGAFLSNFYVCPVCSPTRAEFLTGRYYARCGVFSTSAGGERINSDERILAQTFKDAGYATAAFGKWHNGMQAPYHPNSRGFDEFYGFCSGHWGHYFDPQLEHNGELVRGDGYCVDDFTNRAIEFINANRERPFFVYLPFNTPHSPMQVPDKSWEGFKEKTLTQLPSEMLESHQGDESLDHARAALAMCKNIDRNVGRVLAILDSLKLAENTIVIYFSDNGANGLRFNAGLKGRKGSVDEGGINTPCFIRWPKEIEPATKIDLICGAIDLYPTLLELCGIKETRPKGKPFDGISLLPELFGRSPARANRILISTWRDRISARDDRYRLDAKGRLYDLQLDRGQQNAVSVPDVEKKLYQAVDEFRSKVLSQLKTETHRAFPIGHPSMRWTQMPARDATASGGIKRSNKYPNCSYFLNWVDKTDTITWPIEVMASGRYRVHLYYCLQPKDIGTVLELSVGTVRLRKKLAQSHESPLIGAAQDRTPRTESLVKNFKSIELGTMQLEQGETNLVLKTVEMPGEESIEFRLLMFEAINQDD